MVHGMGVKGGLEVNGVADEAHGVAWDAGMVQGADLRITCIVSEDPLVRSEALFRNHPGQLAPQGVERPVHAGVQ